MPSLIPQHDVQRALAALGVAPQDFDTIRRVPFPQAQTLLQELKAKARRNYKRLALELHPDRTQGDATKAELFVLLGRVLEELDKTVVHPPPPMPQPIAINFAFHTAPTWVSTASTTASTTTTTTFSPQQVIRIVRMRPR
jgi:phytoene dehydrogenase-like protein